MSTQPLTVTELDTTAKPVESAASQATSEVTQPQIAESPKFTDADLEAYNQMVASGITPSTYQEFVSAKRSLDNLPVLMKNNPDLLLDEIEKNDPDLAAKFTERVSDRWYRNYLKTHPEEAQNGNGQNGRASSTSVSDPLVAQLKSTVDALVQERTNERMAQQSRQIADGFNKSIDSLMARIPKEASLTEAEKEYVVLKTKELSASDVSARDRISKGVYVDVPKHFKAAVERLTADKKQSASS